MELVIHMLVTTILQKVQKTHKLILVCSCRPHTVLADNNKIGNGNNAGVDDRTDIDICMFWTKLQFITFADDDLSATQIQASRQVNMMQVHSGDAPDTSSSNAAHDQLLHHLAQMVANDNDNEYCMDDQENEDLGFPSDDPDDYDDSDDEVFSGYHL